MYKGTNEGAIKVRYSKCKYTISKVNVQSGTCALILYV